MSKPSRALHVEAQRLIGPRTFFITSNTWERRRLFRSVRMAKLFLAVLYHYRNESRYMLHEFSLMPEHFHLLVTLDAGISVEKAVQLIKGGFSFRARKETGFKGEIWQRGFSEHQVRDMGHFDICGDYIRQNPVTEGLAPKPEEYQYCSAYPGFELDARPSFQG